MKLLRSADGHPVVALLITTLLLYAGQMVWACRSANPVLLANAAARDRVSLYGQLASSATALLAVSLTVLAILLALPDRPAVQDLRSGPTWLRLQATLLSAALLCLSTLVCALLAAGIDNGEVGKEWLELLLLTCAVMAVFSVLLGGVVFGLFLRVANQPSDPSRGRGEGIELERD